ncbi:uncharacterized protein L201_006550 [Kwoniella dendrophila CBS 6074]|uniref:RRM domain-containing protein n=1 Tax=Kwoniella dendrophila CBS 6074 TaxID=1295534 RepID=A0AAX4K2L3_9TREE
MNTIKEINRINERELQLGVKGSWHDEYKDSAYVFVGGLAYELSEGDILTIFSQWGEIIDINLPRDKETGKTKGFGFLMYEDQRSTVLAVDNMNGSQVLGRTIRVDHTRNYRQPGKRNDEGEYEEPEEPTYNAMPPILSGSESEDSSESEKDDLDEEDPMAAFIRAEKKKAKKEKAQLALTENGKKSNSKRKHEGETKEERKKRKEEKKLKKDEKHRRKNNKIEEERRDDDTLNHSGRRGSPSRDDRNRDQRSPKIKRELSEETRRKDDRHIAGRSNRDDWRDGKFELEREERERERERERDRDRERSRRNGQDDSSSSRRPESSSDFARSDKYDSRERNGADSRNRYRDDDQGDRYRDERDRDNGNSWRYRDDDRDRERDRRSRDGTDRRDRDRYRDERDYKR